MCGWMFDHHQRGLVLYRRAVTGQSEGLAPALYLCNAVGIGSFT